MHVGVGVRVYARVVGEYVFDNFSKSNLIVVRVRVCVSSGRVCVSVCACVCVCGG